MSTAPVHIDALSLTSLYLKLQVKDQRDGSAPDKLLTNATGFAVQRNGKTYLVTNWHVLSGRNPATGMALHGSGAVPDQVRVALHIEGELTTWRFHGESLMEADAAPRWIEHPRGRAFDVAAIELHDLPTDTRILTLDLDLADVDLVLYPGMTVHVIGFPLGLRPNAFFAVWKTGHIASDPDIPFDGRPAFLIDATTREGMSGSIVVARSAAGHITSQGTMFDGRMRTKLLGIYSSRIHEDSEIGCVWRPSVIRELIDAAATRTKR